MIGPNLSHQGLEHCTLQDNGTRSQTQTNTMARSARTVWVVLGRGTVNNRIIHTLVLSLHILKSIMLTTESDVGFTDTEPHHQASTIGPDFISL